MKIVEKNKSKVKKLKDIALGDCFKLIDSNIDMCEVHSNGEIALYVVCHNPLRKETYENKKLGYVSCFNLTDNRIGDFVEDVEVYVVKAEIVIG